MALRSVLSQGAEANPSLGGALGQEFLVGVIEGLSELLNVFVLTIAIRIKPGIRNLEESSHPVSS